MVYLILPVGQKPPTRQHIAIVFQPQAGWVIFSYTPGWVLLGPVTGGAFRAHMSISSLYNSHVWVMSRSSSGRPVKNKCTEIIFNVESFMISANLQYPKLFPLELCFYQFCNKPHAIPSISICINWYWKLNDAYMCLWTMSILIQILACRLFSTKPLSKSMMIFVNWPQVTNLFNLCRN